MDAAELRKYEGKLLDLQALLERDIGKADSEAAPVKLEGVMGRVSRGDAMQVQQMALEVKRQRQQRLMRITTALQRIQEGEYGLCCRCKNPIKPARLDALPDAVLCVHCASSPRSR